MRRLLLALLLLSACDAQSTVESALPKYRGKPVALVFNKWGVPDRTIPGDGGTIYQWRTSGVDGSCRLEVHAGRNGGGGPETVMGIRGVGEDRVCAAWYRML